MLICLLFFSQLTGNQRCWCAQHCPVLSYSQLFQRDGRRFSHFYGDEASCWLPSRHGQAEMWVVFFQFMSRVLNRKEINVLETLELVSSYSWQPKLVKDFKIKVTWKIHLFLINHYLFFYQFFWTAIIDMKMNWLECSYNHLEIRKKGCKRRCKIWTVMGHLMTHDISCYKKLTELGVGCLIETWWLFGSYFFLFNFWKFRCPSVKVQ